MTVKTLLVDDSIQTLDVQGEYAAVCDVYVEFWSLTILLY